MRVSVMTIGLAIAPIVLIGWLAFHWSPRESQLQETQQMDGAQIAREDIKKSDRRDQRTVSETDDVRHSVPLDEIMSGGPPRDGIPSIDNPKFVSSQSASFLSNDDLGIALEMDGVKRYYPFSILVWHEIVNDTINGKRVLVTYCPLCVSGVVFDPLVQGERVEFGTSGKLWNSNLVMYDRKTESLWSQILGEAIVGPMTGTRLAIVPSDVVKFGEWKKKNPSAEVLSKDTGSSRDYTRDPYGNYYSTPGTYFPLKHKDSRLEEKALILGIAKDGKAKAYSIDSIKKQGSIEDSFADMTIVGKVDGDSSVRLYQNTSQGLQRLGAMYSFWFSWAAAHPDTEVYK